MEFQTWNQRTRLAEDEGGAPERPGSWHRRLIDELHDLGADGWEVLTFHHEFMTDPHHQGSATGAPVLVVEYQGVLRRMSPDQVWEYRVQSVLETDTSRPDLLELLHVAIDDLWIVCGYAATQPHLGQPGPDVDDPARTAADGPGIEHWILFKRHRAPNTGD